MMPIPSFSSLQEKMEELRKCAGLEPPTAAAMKWNGILVLLGCIQASLSDTEILNFSSELHSTDMAHLIPTAWPILSRQNNSRILTINPAHGKYKECGSTVDLQVGMGEHCLEREEDLWVALELDDWFPVGLTDSKQDSAQLGERMFTLRISWPASTPVEMTVSLFPSIPHTKSIAGHAKATHTHPPIPPRAEGVMYDLDQHRANEQQSREAQITATNRRMFARLRASTEQFVRSPNNDGAVFPFQFAFLPRWVLPASSQQPSATREPYIDEIRLHITLEPLIMGVLPESSLPGVVFLVALLIVAAICGLPLVNTALSKLANRARKGKGKWSD